jgi:hypothetical protein
MFFERDSKGCVLFPQCAFDTGEMYGLGTQKMVAFVTSYAGAYF